MKSPNRALRTSRELSPAFDAFRGRRLPRWDWGVKRPTRDFPRMRFAFAIAIVVCLSGCAVSSSVGLIREYPSDSAPIVDCYMRAHESLPPFVHYSDEDLPRRAVITVSLNDHRTSQPILRYKRKVKAAPRNLDFTGKLRGDTFTVQVSERGNHQTWTIVFQRRADGQFVLCREVGAFHSRWQ